MKTDEEKKKALEKKRQAARALINDAVTRFPAFKEKADKLREQIILS